MEVSPAMPNITESALSQDGKQPDHSAIQPRFGPVALGVACFLLLQYSSALWRLGHSSGEMDNKFSALAREHHLGFLIQENLKVLLAYGILWIAGCLLLRPILARLPRPLWCGPWWRATLTSAIAAMLLHGFFVLRLAKTRPYFLDEAAFGQWYFQWLDAVPPAMQGWLFNLVFSIVPWIFAAYAVLWHLRPFAWRGRLVALGTAILVLLGGWLATAEMPPSSAPLATEARQNQLNFLIIGSDSLRADKLGCYGYRPERSDGSAGGGVSPKIDDFASKSARFERCYTAIASTMESGTQLIASQYPHTHGLRYMYPDRQTIDQVRQNIVPFTRLLHQAGYETSVIGDWCAGYNEVVPLEFQKLSVSSFDNFKIYMSQAVVMAHFVVPLYFDHPIGYKLFPQLESFAQFVTPRVVTSRVNQALESAAKSGRPFFHHVFYSCNHLPYRSNEPYTSWFADPGYRGKNRSGVDFDIDAFIGGTDLESKWKALPPDEVRQIRALYDGCTRQFDDCVGEILTTLKNTGLDQNTVVVITADHGDDLYEPGVTLGHGLTFNGGLQANRVPMIVHVPGLPPMTIAETVRLIDVIPTLAELGKLKPSAVWEGRSFAGWLMGTEAPVHRPFFGETGFPFIQFSVPGVTRPKLPPMDEMTFIDPQFNYQFVLKPEFKTALVQAKQRCLRTRDWKLVCTPVTGGGRHFGLFHLASDPDGLNDLAHARPDVLKPMQSALEAWIDQRRESTISQIFPNGEPSHP